MAEKKFFVNVDLQGNFINNLKADTLDITTNSASENAKRIIFYNNSYYYSDGTNWINISNEYTSQVKHEVKAGVALTKGQAVYITDANGTNMIVGKASNGNESTSSKTLGLIDSTLAINDFGYVVTEGLLSGLNTGSATIGDAVWLGTNGNLIFGLTNKPVAPAHLVYIGVVTRVSSTVGEIFINIQNGFEVSEIHDISLSSLSNKDFLYYDSPTHLWKNGTLEDILTITSNGTSGSSTIIGNTLNIPEITSVAFSPINVAVCDSAPTASSTQYYYQTIAEKTGSINKAKLWGFSGSDNILFGIYRGKLGGTMTLIGQGSKVCGIGSNEIDIVAESGQNLNLTAGEDLVVGYYADGTSWRTVYDTGISDANFGIVNTNNISTMPSNPTGTATAIRFALTLY